MSRREPDISAIVVTYNSAGLAEAALESASRAAAAAGLAAEVIVVDNASTDATVDGIAAAFPTATLIRSQRNLGFGAANNLAFERARGRYWLLLNPDAAIESDGLGRLVRALEEDAQLAAVGPSIAGSGHGAESAGELPGLRSLAAHFLFVNRILPGDRGGPWRGWQLRPGRGGDRRSVGWLSAAVMLARPEAIRSVGGFDSTIFLYGEDADLGERLARAGWRLALVPGATATHAIGGTQPGVSVRWVGGLDGYLARRGRHSIVRRACLLVMAVGLAARALASRRAGRVHARRMRAAAGEALRRALALPAAGG